MKRRYTHIKIQSERIRELRASGRTRREIAEELGYTKEQIKGWIKRENKRKGENGYGVRKQRGRKAAVTLQEYKYEIKRLKMENELLRDFLRLAGRK